MAETVTLSPGPFSRFKTHNALPYVLAGLERQRRQLDDLILLDTQGHVAEACYSNVFWHRQGVWYTPHLSTGCLAGVMRYHLLQCLAAAGSGPECEENVRGLGTAVNASNASP